MSEGNWTGCLCTPNGAGYPFYEVTGARLVESGHERDGIRRWSGKFPVTIVVTTSLKVIGSSPLNLLNVRP
jgi:hypothetical protein